jgi:hypothetical protein
MGGEERYSLPFFFSPNEDARVSVLEQFRREGECMRSLGWGSIFSIGWLLIGGRIWRVRRGRREGTIERGSSLKA